MSESNEISLSKNTIHPDHVKTYMRGGKDEQSARDLVARDLIIDKVRRDVEEQKRRSLIDPLTGLPNRRALFGDDKVNPPVIGRLEEIFQHAKRNNEPMAVVMVDLDFFKKYNDSHGHLAGDVALQALAQVIRGVIRHSDFAARFGGEEFAIILPDTDMDQAQVLIERLRKTVEGIPLKEAITISAGLAVCDKDSYSSISSPNELVGKADKLLYFAKEKGRNRVEYETSLHS